MQNAPQAGEPYPLLQRLPMQSIACVRAMGLTLPPPAPPPHVQLPPQKEAPSSALPVYGYGTVRGGSYGPLPGDPGADAGVPPQWVLAALQAQALGQAPAHPDPNPGAHPAPSADAARADGDGALAPASAGFVPAGFAAEAGFAVGAPLHDSQPAAPAQDGVPVAQEAPNCAACAAGPSAACGGGCQPERAAHAGAAGLANGSAAHHAADGM